MQDKFKANYFISLFSSCRCMSMYKSYMLFAKYCNPKLSGDIKETMIEGYSYCTSLQTAFQFY